MGRGKKASQPPGCTQKKEQGNRSSGKGDRAKRQSGKKDASNKSGCTGMADRRVNHWSPNLEMVKGLIGP